MSVKPQGHHEVFISYSSKDKQWADAACAVLERQRIRCWVAPRDIIPGSEWGASIIAAIDACKIMVLIFSGHANASAQVRREVERAISKGLSVLPCRVENIAPSGAMEYALSNTHWLDAFTPPVEQQLEVLARSVKTLLTHSTARPQPIRAEEGQALWGQVRLSPKSLAVAASAMLLLAGIAVGLMLTRGKPAEPGPPTVTGRLENAPRRRPADPQPPTVPTPAEKAARRQAALAARYGDRLPVARPPATPPRARPEPKAIAAVNRPEPKVVAVVRWTRDDIPGQQASDWTYYENNRINDSNGNITWSLSKGVLKNIFSPQAYTVCWFAPDGNSLRGANVGGPTFSGQVIKGSFGDTTSQPITAIAHWKEDHSAFQGVHIYYAKGRINDPDGNIAWSLVNGGLKVVIPGAGPSGGDWICNARVAPDGKSWRGADNMRQSFTARVVSGSFQGATR